MKIFYDVDTQNDFMNKDGALYVPGAEEIKPNLKKLTDYARAQKIPVLGSVDKHFGTPEYKEREGELARWGGPFPDHCMDGTYGWAKINETNIPLPPGFSRGDFYTVDWFLSHILTAEQSVEDILAEDNTCEKLSWGMESESIEKRISLFRELVKAGDLVQLKKINSEIERRKTGIDKYEIRQISTELYDSQYSGLWAGFYFEKQSYDVFTNPKTEALLAAAEVKEAVVYGVATDYCVKAAVLGMQKRGIQCYVVEDAIKGVAPETTKSALEEMLEAGAKFVKTEDVLEGVI